MSRRSTKQQTVQLAIIKLLTENQNKDRVWRDCHVGISFNWWKPGFTLKWGCEGAMKVEVGAPIFPTDNKLLKFGV